MVFEFMRRKGTPISPPEAKASAAAPVIAWAGAGRVAWSPRETGALARQAIDGHPLALALAGHGDPPSHWVSMASNLTC